MRKSILLFLLAFAPTLLAPSNTIEAQTGGLSISGVVWNDRNADGIRQTEEPGMPVVPLQMPPSQGFQFGRLARTNLAGEYRFEGLVSGSYTIGFPSAGNPYFLTHPERKGVGRFAVAVALNDQSITGFDFGLHAPIDAPAFTGLSWIDATFVDAPDVRAWIDGVDCTGGLLVTPHHSGYGRRVLPSSLVPGCGEPGKLIRFTLNGRPANETGMWLPRVAMFDPPQSLDLTVGPPFAYFTPEIILPSGFNDSYGGQSINAFVDGAYCSSATHFGQAGALLAVPAREQRPGCGYEGATIFFTYEGRTLSETAVWRPGPHEGPVVILDHQPGADPTALRHRFQVFNRNLTGLAPDGTRIEIRRLPNPRENPAPGPRNEPNLCAEGIVRSGFVEIVSSFTPVCPEGTAVGVIVCYPGCIEVRAGDLPPGAPTRELTERLPIVAAAVPSIEWRRARPGEAQPRVAAIRPVQPNTGGVAEAPPGTLPGIRPPTAGDGGLLVQQ